MLYSGSKGPSPTVSSSSPGLQATQSAAVGRDYQRQPVFQIERVLFLSSVKTARTLIQNLNTDFILKQLPLVLEPKTAVGLPEP